MPSNKRSVYLTDETLAALGLPADEEDRAGWSLSGRLNMIAGRYQRVITAAMPSFTRGEWCAILDANNGTIFDADSLRLLPWANVADSPELGEKWEVDLASLIAKMRELRVDQCAAMCEGIERFWRYAELPTAKAMKKAGLPVAD